MLETTRNLLGDILSGKIKDERLRLVADELTASERKLSDAMLKIHDLEVRLQTAEARLSQFQIEKPADICPFCHRATGKLVEIREEPLVPRGRVMVKQGYYKCGNDDCGKEYDKPMA
jgi:hypothetical protein